MIHALAAQYGTISDIEVLWTTIAAAGALLSISNVRHAHIDKQAARLIGNGRRWIAAASFQVEVARLVIQLIFISIGLFAMTFPDPPAQLHQPWRAVVFGALFRWGMIVSASLVTFQSWTNRQTRIRVLAADDSERQNHGL